MGETSHSGLVVRVTGNEVWVVTGGRMVPCLLRGRLRQQTGLQVLAGDQVEVMLPEREGEAGTVESVAERESVLSRFVERVWSERGIVANVALLFVVATLKSPDLQYAFIDRVLVSGEHGGVRCCVVLNKIDLHDSDATREFAAVYEGCGYDVYPVSAVSGEGLDALAAGIGGGIYAFVGASGVGKSSLLNRLDPALDIRTQQVGEKTKKGRHTTTSSQLYSFRQGYLADTPGVQKFGFAGDDKTVLGQCFPEFRSLDGQCRFHPCTHSHEPGCAVKDAGERGRIADSRYQSYLHILAEIEERESRRRR